MMPNKTDRHDARGLAQIVRTGWFKAVQIKSHDAYVSRAMLTAREALVGMRVRLENEIRGLLKTFGVMFGKRVGGFKRRAEEIISRDLAVAPELIPIFEALMHARRDILARIAALDSRIRATAKRHATVRLLMTAPGVGPITAMAVVAAFDDAARFRRSSSAGAYLGLTPRRYESGEISRNGRVSKRGDGFTRKCLFEAANAIFCRGLGGPRLRNWAKANRRADRAMQSQGRAGAEAGRHAACHVAHQHALPRGGVGIDPTPETTLILSATECVQSGRAARVRSLPGLRQGPRTPLRSTQP